MDNINSHRSRNNKKIALYNFEIRDVKFLLSYKYISLQYIIIIELSQTSHTVENVHPWYPLSLKKHFM